MNGTCEWSLRGGGRAEGRGAADCTLGREPNETGQSSIALPIQIDPRQWYNLAGTMHCCRHDHPLGVSTQRIRLISVSFRSSPCLWPLPNAECRPPARRRTHSAGSDPSPTPSSQSTPVRREGFPSWMSRVRASPKHRGGLQSALASCSGYYSSQLS